MSAVDRQSNSVFFPCRRLRGLRIVWRTFSQGFRTWARLFRPAGAGAWMMTAYVHKPSFVIGNIGHCIHVC